MPRGLPMVGALVRDDAKKIQIVVEYKCIQIHPIVQSV